ncbi:MAG: rhodanese-like domain-containing protein, partial [Candidatus Binatia bacterium]
VGFEGVEKRIDVIAAAIRFGATVSDLAEMELCYAPQYGAAKDPVNLAGMIADNVLRGDMPLAAWESLGTDGALLLDVREPAEFAAGAIPGAVNVPLSQLRARVGELPRDRAIHACCGVGQRGYFAVRFLRQNGFDACNLSGGYATYGMRKAAGV